LPVVAPARKILWLAVKRRRNGVRILTAAAEIGDGAAGVFVGQDEEGEGAAAEIGGGLDAFAAVEAKYRRLSASSSDAPLLPAAQAR
jgi:hypothetical protein